MFISWIGWSGEDANTDTQQPTSKRSVAKVSWTAAERAFAVKAFYKNGYSLVITQRESGREFGTHCN
jgi:hypothetical protein